MQSGRIGLLILPKASEELEAGKQVLVMDVWGAVPSIGGHKAEWA